ncbi:acyltransferase [Streptomyces gobiensis]|uniref:acyltransferase n=1 Tax=Streptomyces gobiensis TaxID=2875706 RepID=UPI0024119177|nr:acyltransferase [Streptomyces gobiensis]UGY91830.1 acyltransferase [Streptomyces gobiensis]
MQIPEQSAPSSQPGSSQLRSSQPAEGKPAAARREHRYDIDLMRLICSCAVMLGHVGATFISAVDRQEANGPGAYWVGHIADSANEFAVPMYFAMAGWAVLVGAPPRDSGQIWQRIVRNGLPLFIWTGAYLSLAWMRSRNEEPITELAVDSLFGSVRPAYHLWFMYAYIPIIAVLAFAMLVKAGKRPWRLGLALLATATAPSVLTTFGELTGWDTPSFGWGFGTYSLVYAVGGALLFALPTGVPHRHRWLLLPVLLAAFAGCLWYNTQVQYVIPNAHLFVAALTLCVLLLVSRVRIPVRLRPVLSKLAGAALGAYMVHVFFVEELVRPMVSASRGGLVSGVLLIGLLLATVTLSYAASLLWGQLRLRRFLG